MCLGPEGNDFVLNGKLSEISAAEVYRGLTVATFGKGVCYDASPAKFMEQKKVRSYNIFNSNKVADVNFGTSRSSSSTVSPWTSFSRIYLFSFRKFKAFSRNRGRSKVKMACSKSLRPSG